MLAIHASMKPDIEHVTIKRRATLVHSSSWLGQLLKSANLLHPSLRPILTFTNGRPLDCICSACPQNESGFKPCCSWHTISVHLPSYETRPVLLAHRQSSLPVQRRRLARLRAQEARPGDWPGPAPWPIRLKVSYLPLLPRQRLSESSRLSTACADSGRPRRWPVRRGEGALR